LVRIALVLDLDHLAFGTHWLDPLAGGLPAVAIAFIVPVVADLVAVGVRARGGLATLRPSQARVGVAAFGDLRVGTDAAARHWARTGERLLVAITGQIHCITDAVVVGVRARGLSALGPR